MSTCLGENVLIHFHLNANRPKHVHAVNFKVHELHPIKAHIPRVSNNSFNDQ